MKTKIMGIIVSLLLILTALPTVGIIVKENSFSKIELIGEHNQTIPVLKFESIKGDLLGISVVLKNLGYGTAFDIFWEMNISGGSFYYPRMKNGTINDPLGSGEETQIDIKPLIGMGRGDVFFYCRYKMIIDSSRSELEVELKQEGQNQGRLFRHEFKPEYQPIKQWMDVEDFEYKEVGSLKLVELKPEYNITNMHNVRVLDYSKSNILFMGACCFENGLGILDEGWITKDYIENELAYWEIELIDSEIVDQENSEDLILEYINIDLYQDYKFAQEFVPTSNIVPWVELFIERLGSITSDFKVSIRSSLNGTDLTSISVPYYKIAKNYKSWIGFDFENIFVTPGETYFIVCSTSGGDIFDNHYSLYVKENGSYIKGSLWFQKSSGEWEENPLWDMYFKTYFIDNPFKAPTIAGPSTGMRGEELVYKIVSNCPEEGDIYYKIDRGLKENFERLPATMLNFWIGPFTSGKEIIIKQTWHLKNDYPLRVKAKNIDGGESDWGYLLVTIERGNPVYDFILQLLDKFPNAFPILRILLDINNLY